MVHVCVGRLLVWTPEKSIFRGIWERSGRCGGVDDLSGKIPGIV